MFNAPDIIEKIPDIAQIYRMNEIQEKELENAVDKIEKNIFISDMDEDMIHRWEMMLEITPLDNESIEERRFRIKSRIMEKLPYSYRVIYRKIETLCMEGFVIEINENRTEIKVKLALHSKRMIDDVRKILDEMLPLNMVFDVSIIWNRHIDIMKWTYGTMANRTYKQIREEIMEEI